MIGDFIFGEDDFPCRPEIMLEEKFIL